MFRLRKATACLTALVLTLSFLITLLPQSALALGEGEATGGVDFDSSNGVISRLLYGTTFYIDWKPGNGLTNQNIATPGRDCSGSAANGANPDMVLSMTLTFEAIDGVSDPAACWSRIALRLRSSKVDDKEQASEFTNIYRKDTGNASQVDVAIPLSEFGKGSINWADLKELIIQVPVESAYQLEDTGDSPALRLTVANARIVNSVNLAARVRLQELLDCTADYRYAADDAAIAYEQVRQEATVLLEQYADEATCDAMTKRLEAAIDALTDLQDVAERADNLAGPPHPVTPQNGSITLDLTGKTDLSLHDPDALALRWEGENAAPVTGGQAVLHTADEDMTVSFDDLQEQETDGFTRFYLPLPGIDTLTGVTLTMQTAGDFRLTDAYVGDMTQQAEQTAFLEKLTHETPQLYTPTSVLADDHASAVAAAEQILESGVFAATADIRSARVTLQMSRHAWQEIAGGDVDDNMQITAADALLALQAATNKITLEDPNMADIDKKDGVTANDALQILQFATKKIASFPQEDIPGGVASLIADAITADGKYQVDFEIPALDEAAVGFTGEGGYLAYRNLDFGTGGLHTFMAVLAVDESAAEQTLDIHIDTVGGPVIGSLSLTASDVYAEQYAALTSNVTGVHDIYLTAPAGVRLDSFVFSTYTGEETAEEKADRMAWWNDARFGMFIHWGAYANFPFSETHPQKGYSEWVQYDLRISKEEYEQLAVSTFNPQNWDADEIVRLAQNAGQKYIVFTSKHHEGYSMFDTRVTGFKDFSLQGYGLYQGDDPLMQLAQASREAGIPFGCYYSTQDWRHPSQENWSTVILDKAGYVADMKAQLRELIQNYDLDILWFDGEWQPWWNSADGQDLYRYLRTLKPSLIINNRIGKRAVTDGDFGTPEQEIPPDGLDYDWESCITMNGSWGYSPTDTRWKTPQWIVQSLVNTASKGGNLLLNIGPDAQGTVPEDCAANMRTAGEWLAQYGESIYGTTASPFTDALPFGAATKKDGALYLHVLNRPSNGKIIFPALRNTVLSATVLGQDVALTVEQTGDDWSITLPADAAVDYDTVIVIEVEGMPQAQNTYTYSDNYVLNKSATASNVYQNDYRYTGAAAVDGKSATRWATDNNVSDCTLEVELGGDVTFNCAIIEDYEDRVMSYNIEYWDDNSWKVAYSGGSIGERSTVHFEPVTAQKVRLHILTVQGKDGPSIYEFGLYTATRDK